MAKQTEAQKAIERLIQEAYQKLDEAKELALENNESAYFQLDGRSFSVFNENDYADDEETLEYFKDNGVQHGEWTSSSSFC